MVAGQQFEAVRIPLPDTAVPYGDFGKRVAVAPPWAAVGQPATPPGVFLYTQTPTGWRLTQSIIEENSSSFGDAIAIDGDTLVIGAPRWDFTGERKGKVFVYERDGTQWRRTQELQPAGLRYFDLFGDAVALDGDVLAVGAPNVDSPGTNHGAVFIYERSGLAWDLASVFRYDDQSAASQPQAGLGRSVAVSDRTVVAGAELVGNFVGEVWVFEREVTGWRHTAVLADPTPTNGDHFGKSVAIFRDTLVASEGGQAIAGFAWKQGSALVFDRSPGGDWQLVQEIEASDGFNGADAPDGFGYAVAIEGDTIAAGMPGSPAGAHCSGGVYLFERNSAGGWPHHETQVFVPSDPDITSSCVGLGASVDLRDGFVLSGAPIVRSAYVFEIESGLSFCNPAPNSTGEPGHLAAVFSAGGDGILSVHDAPPSTLGLFLASPTLDVVVFQPSSLCLGAGIWRLDPIAPTGGAGTVMNRLDLSGSSGPVGGVTFYFQYWFLDPFAAVGTFNFTNAVMLILP